MPSPSRFGLGWVDPSIPGIPEYMRGSGWGTSLPRREATVQIKGTDERPWTSVPATAGLRMNGERTETRRTGWGPPRARSGTVAARSARESDSAPIAVERFRSLDRYRVDREWNRYQGTAQRRLWREIRERFLERHAPTSRWALDLGSGPGRFTPWAGGPGTRAVALDLSREMLLALPARWSARHLTAPVPDRVRGNAVRPPFRPGVFGAVMAMGNAVGFAEASSDRLLEQAMRLVGPGGTLLLEIAPGPGERSRYLTRLPVASVGRLVRAPVAALLPRIEREGFVAERPRRSTAGAFHRVAATDLVRRFERSGWTVAEVLAVAPALGSDPERIRASATDPKAWGHLLQIEEAVGRRPERWVRAAAVLTAAVRDRVNRLD